MESGLFAYEAEEITGEFVISESTFCISIGDGGGAPLCRALKTTWSGLQNEAEFCLRRGE
jgi:hypothetical protein